MGSKAFGLLRSAVGTVLCLAILGGILLPIYSDEVGWRLQERAGFDGIDKLYTELCGPNTLARPPFFMMPVRWYSALFNGLFPDPLYVRLSGVVYALAWIAMLALLIRRITEGSRDRALLGIVAFGLMSLGTMPLLLVWSRPEQPVVLAFTAAIMIAFADGPAPSGETSQRQAWWRSLAILALGIVALSYHIKAVFLVPLLLACLVLASRGRGSRLPQALAAVILVIATAFAAQYWIHRLECPADAVFKADFARNNAGAVLVNASGFAEQFPIVIRLLENVKLIDYFALPTPRYQPLSFWLAGGQISDEASFRWFLALIFTWWGAMLCGAACFIAAVLRGLRARRLDPRLIVAGMALAAALGWSATQGVRNVYEATFVLPLAMLAIVLSLATREEESALDKYVVTLAAVLGVLGLASPPAIASIFGPSLFAAQRHEGYIPWQPYSQNAFAYRTLKADILGAARQCGIRDPHGQTALLIDDVTYFAFMQSRLPQHKLGLINRTSSVKDPIAYLRGRGSTGIVLACAALPHGLRARAKQQGQFCCLAPPGW